MKVLFIAIGSGLGGVLRHWVSCWLGAGGGFPFATLAVNVVGSLLIGVVSGFLMRHVGQSAESVRAFAVVGFCGGFTTFSTFSNETYRMIENGQFASAAAYVGLSVLAAIAAVFLGHWILKGTWA